MSRAGPYSRICPLNQRTRRRSLNERLTRNCAVQQPSCFSDVPTISPYGEPACPALRRDPRQARTIQLARPFILPNRGGPIPITTGGRLHSRAGRPVSSLDMDVEQAQRFGHLLSPLPPEMRDDTAFMDRVHAYAPGWEFSKLDPRTHFTSHFGLVSDFLSECWTRLRSGSRVSAMHDRVHLGGALSGRDIEAVNKTVSGLLKLLFPDPEMPITDEDLEWVVRLTLEARRRVKEQQKRVFKSEFRNTHFSYTLSPDGIEQFVSPPELHSDQAIESVPLPPGQVWGVSMGSGEAGAGLYRIEVASSRGSGVRILNQPPPPAFKESVRVGEQNLYARCKELVGDRNPREEEFSIQMRSLDAEKSGTGLGVPILVAMCGSMLGKNTRGGTIVVGALNLGGSIDMIPNAVRIAELAVDKQATTLLMPVSARRQLNGLPDELWTRINIEFYKDSADAVLKSLVD